MPPAALPIIAIAAAGAGAGLSFVQAQQQNRAIKKAEEATRRSADVQSRQTNDQASVERQKRLNENAQVKARLSLLAGETGLQTGDYSGLFQQAGTDLTTNLDILNQNLRNQLDLISSGRDANLAELGARKQNAFLSTLSGGLSGLQTGLSIASLSNSLGQTGTTTTGNPYGVQGPPDLRR